MHSHIHILNIWLTKDDSLCLRHMFDLTPIHSIYGATAPSGPWPPSKRASTRHHFLLFSSIFSFLIIAMHLSEPHPPIWFLAFPLVLCCRMFKQCSYVPSAKNQFLFLIAESSSICWTFPRQLRSFHNITFFSGMGLSAHAQPPTWRTRVSLFVWVISFDLSGMGAHASSYATAGLALRIIWPLEPHHCVKVGTPSVGNLTP